MKRRCFAPLLAALVLGFSFLTAAAPGQTGAAEADAPAKATLGARGWEYGPVFQGGEGVGARYGFTFTSAGFELGKVITGEHLPGFARGQFEFVGQLLPYWQAFTPPPHLGTATATDPATGLQYTYTYPIGGGTYTGVELMPVVLRWDFKPHRKFAPWFQAAGGLIYTTHKFPPDALVPHGTPGGTSVFNFSPQGGIGLQYFIRPGRSIYVLGSGVHISSASLGDRNPGVNASVQFQIGYSFWSRP